MIQQVESLEAELEFKPLCNGRGLHGAKVEADVLWPAQDAATRVAENFLRSRKGNRRRIPPVQKLFKVSKGASTSAKTGLCGVALMIECPADGTAIPPTDREARP